ncbi:MAG: DUF3179 domain-containing protein [Acidimicrobiia bacterium]|nr:DUF3179 domain-containing protein [Acidimicrobiia bacterium]
MERHGIRRTGLAAVAVLLLVACGSGSDSSSSADRSPPEEYPDAITRHLARLAAEERPVPRSAMPPRHLDAVTFPETLVPRERIVSGGPPPDGIPPIDEPRFEPVSAVDWLTPDEPVMALVTDDAARAYPVRVLIWHEIVNDEFDGDPVLVSYCPLCSSGLAYDRRVGDDVLDFGTSGALFQANLVMYDRQTESLWTQFDGRAVVGDRIGDELDPIALATISWREFADLHPGGDVLSQDTGFDKPYGQNPYTSYEERTDPVPGFFTGEADPTLPAFERIIGIESGDEAIAVQLRDLVDAGVVETTLDDRPITVWHVAGTTSPLSGADFGEGERIGSTEVYVSIVDGVETSFSPIGDGTFEDEATGSTWTILGAAVAGPAAGSRLEAVPHVDTFWFSWSTFYVDGVIVQP